MSTDGKILSPDFFAQPTLLVARFLIGMHLVRFLNGIRLSGIITETEAYIGETDLACHARSGRTQRNSVMYGPPGFAYVYFTYGKHWMLNAITEREGFPAAVLLRAIKPIEGIKIINNKREGRDTEGPAKLTQALEIDNRFNGINLCEIDSELWIEQGDIVPDENVTISPRVGLYSVPEPWKSKPWRYKVNLQSCF